MTILLSVSLTLICVIILATIINIIDNNKNKHYSFQESLQKHNAPVAVFNLGRKRVNFLIDSGSSASHVSKEFSDTLLCEVRDTDYTVFGLNGSSNSSKVIDLELKSKGRKFKNSFFINPGLDESFRYINETENLNLSGIIGSDFLSKFNYKIDFKKFIAVPQ